MTRTHNLDIRKKKLKKAATMIMLFGLLMIITGVGVGFTFDQLQPQVNDKRNAVTQQDNLEQRNAILTEYASRWDSVYQIVKQLKNKEVSTIEAEVVELRYELKELGDWVEEHKSTVNLELNFKTDEKLFELVVGTIIELVKKVNNTPENCSEFKQAIAGVSGKLDRYNAQPLNIAKHIGGSRRWKSRFEALSEEVSILLKDNNDAVIEARALLQAIK